MVKKNNIKKFPAIEQTTPKNYQHFDELNIYITKRIKNHKNNLMFKENKYKVNKRMKWPF